MAGAGLVESLKQAHRGATVLSSTLAFDHGRLAGCTHVSLGALEREGEVLLS